MSGEELFQCLGAMTLEQRKLLVFTRAEDVGYDRKTVYNPCDSIRVRNIPADEEEGRNDTTTGLVIS